MKIAKIVNPAAFFVLMSVSVISKPGRPQDAGSAKTIETLASFPAGYGLEALTQVPDGTIYFDMSAGGAAALWKLDPDGKVEKWVDLPISHPQVVISTKDGFLVTGAMTAPLPAKGNDADTDPDRGSQLVALNKSGAITKVIHAGPHTFLNGIGQVGTSDEYLIADALDGVIWRADLTKDHLELWLRHDLLAPTTARPYPGINGLKVYGDWVYFTNTALGSMYRVRIGKDERPEGMPSLVVAMGADDFGVTKDGTIYLPSGSSMLKIPPSGVVSTFIEMPVNNPTAAIVSNDQHWLYWVSRGNNSPDPKPVPRIFRVRID